MGGCKDEDGGLSIKFSVARIAAKNADLRVGEILIRSTELGTKVIVSIEENFRRGERNEGGC